MTFQYPALLPVSYEWQVGNLPHREQAVYSSQSRSFENPHSPVAKKECKIRLTTKPANGGYAPLSGFLGLPISPAVILGFSVQLGDRKVARIRVDSLEISRKIPKIPRGTLTILQLKGIYILNATSELNLYSGRYSKAI